MAKINSYVKNVLTPGDLKGREPVQVECVNDADHVEWNGKKIDAMNFLGSLDGEAFDVKIFTSRVHCEKGEVVEVLPGKKYSLKYKDDKSFLIKEA